MSDESCPTCGAPTQDDGVFSDDALRLAMTIAETNDPVERKQLMIELSDIVAEDVMDFLLEVPEGAHQMLNELAHVRLEYEQAALRVARAFYPAIRQVAVRKGVSPVSDLPPQDKPPAKKPN
jgi:hypothetical protein